MAEVKPYKDGTGKKEQIRKMFDTVAGRYDMMNRLLSMGVDIGWRRRLIKLLTTYSPLRILDMATGTGDLSIMAAKQIPDAHITAIDLSSKMIELAEKKKRKAHLTDRILFKVGDSENISEDTDSFDGAMIAFGIRNFENLNQGLSELHRVLKPGAPLFILEFSKPTIFPVKQVFNTYFKLVVPLLGKLLSKDADAYQYLYDSVQNFPDYDQLNEVLLKVGFKESKWESLSFGICCLYTSIK